MKGTLLLFATSMVKLIAGCASLNVARKAVAVGISFTAAWATHSEHIYVFDRGETRKRIQVTFIL